MSKNDTKIKKLLSIIDEKKAAWGPRPRTQYKTNCLLKVDGVVNINVAGKAALIDAFAQMLNKSKTHDEACQRLGVSDAPFSWCGYSLNDWQDDIKARISIIQWEANAASLEVMQTKLEALVSEDCKTELALDGIAKLLIDPATLL